MRLEVSFALRASGVEVLSSAGARPASDELQKRVEQLQHRLHAGKAA